MVVNVLLTVLLSTSSLQEEGTAEQISKLVHELRSDSVDVRARAASQLGKLGPESIPELEKWLDDPDVELQARVRHVIRIICTVKRLTPKLIRAYPGIENRLSNGNSLAWTTAFEEALGSHRSVLDGGLGRSDLEALAAPAIRAALAACPHIPNDGSALEYDLVVRRRKAEERVEALIQEITIRGLRTGIRELLKPLGEEEKTFRSHIDQALDEFTEHGAPGLAALVLPEERLYESGLWVGAHASRTKALRILGEMFRRGDPRGALDAVDVAVFLDAGEVFPEALSLLSHESPRVRGEAAFKLRELTLPEAVPLLRRLLEDTDETVRWKASRALGRARDPAVVPAALKLLGSGSKDARTHACFTLGDLGDQKHLKHLLEVVNGDDKDLRSTAMYAINDIRPSGCADLFAPLLSDHDPQVRRWAATVIGHVGDVRHLAVLSARLNEKEDWVRASIVDAIGQLKNPKGLRAITKYLEDPTWDVRTSAVRAVAALGKKDVAHLIIPLLKDDNYQVRYHASWILDDIGSPQLAPRIIPLLKHKKPGVRESAARSLGLTGARSSVALLRDLLSDPDPEVRREAVYALYRLNNETAVPQMKRLLDDAFTRVRTAAATYLAEKGVREGIESVLSGEGRLSDLNAIRSPGGWAALRNSTRVTEAAGSRRELLEGLCRRAEFTWNTQLDSVQVKTWLARNDWVYDSSLHAAFLSMMDHERYTFILNGNEIRILGYEEALGEWKRWWMERNDKQ